MKKTVGIQGKLATKHAIVAGKNKNASNKAIGKKVKGLKQQDTGGGVKNSLLQTRHGSVA